jgi:phosphoglycerate dehydrogenase-like enzyme
MPEPLRILSLPKLPRATLEAVALLAPHAVIEQCPRQADGFPPALARAEIVVGGLKPADLSNAPRLRWIQFTSAGVHGWTELPAGLTLTTAAGVFAIPIAEHVMGMMLAFSRQLPAALSAMHGRQWQRPQLTELHGATCLILGLGHIGVEIAQRAKAFGMRVIGIRRTRRPAPGCVDEVRELGELDQLLPQADHLVVALPGTPHTHHLLDARRLALMKPQAYLYNVGRGSVIDEAAMVAALQAGRLAGAGLDVFETEPLPPQSPLWALPNVIITAHNSSSSPHWPQRLGALFVENLQAYLQHQPMKNLFNPRWGY